MFNKIERDPIFTGLICIMAVLFIAYQAGGGENSSSVLVRDLINIFWWAAFPLLLAYLIIRPFLQKSLNKTKSTKGKVFKSSIGLGVAIIIAAIGVFLVFSMVFALVMSLG